jgi:hypothetical protein
VEVDAKNVKQALAIFVRLYDSIRRFKMYLWIQDVLFVNSVKECERKQGLCRGTTRLHGRMWRSKNAAREKISIDIWYSTISLKLSCWAHT